MGTIVPLACHSPAQLDYISVYTWMHGDSVNLKWNLRLCKTEMLLADVNGFSLESLFEKEWLNFLVIANRLS